MANKEFGFDEREWLGAGAALTCERGNPIDHRLIGRIVYAIAGHYERDARGMQARLAAAGPELDGYRGSSAQRKQRKSGSANHLSGQRSESGQQLFNRADAARRYKRWKWRRAAASSANS